MAAGARRYLHTRILTRRDRWAGSVPDQRTNRRGYSLDNPPTDEAFEVAAELKARPAAEQQTGEGSPPVRR